MPPPILGTKKRQSHSTALPELVVLTIIGLLLFTLTYYFNLFDGFTATVAGIAQPFNAGEIVVGIAFVIIAAAFFSYRRWKEAQVDLAQAQAADAALQTVLQDLERRIQERTQNLASTNAQLEAEILKRQVAREEIEAREKRFRALLENSSDAITLLAADGTALYDSPAAPRLLGYEPDELLSHNVFDYIHPDDTAPTSALFQQLLQHPGTRAQAEFRFKHKNGTWRSIRAVASNLLAEPAVQAIVVNYQDVTERKRLDDSLTADRNLLRTVIDNIPDQIFVKDRQSRFLIANPAVLRERKIASETELLGKTDLDFFGRPEAESYLAEERALMESDHSAIDEDKYYVGTVTGQPRWLQVNKLPLRDPQGQVIGLVGIIRDVTTIKSAEQKLRESEEHYRLLFDSSPLPMWVFDVETLAFLSVNDSAIAHYGYSRAEFLAMTILDIRPADEKQAVLETVAVSGGPRRQSGIWHHRKKDGSLIDVEVFAHDLPFEGQPSRLVLVNDITERKNAEAAQAQANLMFRTLFDNSPDSIVLIDPRADWPIVDCNEAACEMNGYSRAELIGQSIDILNADPNALIDRAATLASLKSHANIKYETVHRRKDGTIFPIDVSSTLINLGGQQRVLGIDRDITERRQRLRELEAVESISGALRAAVTQKEMVRVITDQTKKLLDAEVAALDMKDPLSNQIITEQASGDWTDLIGQRHSLGDQSITSGVIASGKIYLSGNLSAEPHLNQSALVDGIRAVIALPLITADQLTIGALWVGRRLSFTPAEIQLLTSVANIAATALSRAILLEQAERHLQNLAALRDIDQAISSSLDLKLSLAVVLGHVLKQLQIDACAILIHQEAQLQLTYVAGAGFHTSIFKSPRVRLGQGLAGQAALERKMVHVNNFALVNPGSLTSLIRSEGFVEYYGIPLLAKGKVLGVLELFQRHTQPHNPDWLEFTNALAGQAAIAIDNVQLYESLQKSNIELVMAYDATIEGWSKALDLRDKETEGHSQRVTDLTLELARRKGLNEIDLIHIRRGALLHDIGKMGVPDNILLKEGPLTEAEWVIMKKHPQLAQELLSPIAYLRQALDIPYCHHEMWDGSGYPRGLAGQQIPLAARLFSIVDVWDALRSDRPYRAAWPVAKARDHIRSLSGKHFDPEVVTLFLQTLGSG